MKGGKQQQADVRRSTPAAPVRPARGRGHGEVAGPAGHAFSGIAIQGGPVVQAKLEVGPADDAYEREADRVAEEVMKDPESRLREDPVQGGGPQHIQRMCTDCEDEEKAQMAPDPDVQPVEPVADLGDRVAALRGSGAPLPEAARASLEARLGHDFSRVRIHTGHRAQSTARAIGARAFTVGQDVVFAAGEYDPASAEGRRLLAHELTHVVQQTGGSDGAQRAERHADVPAPPRRRREDEEAGR
jgi:hypothetical protein